MRCTKCQRERTAKETRPLTGIRNAVVCKDTKSCDEIATAIMTAIVARNMARRKR